MRSEPLVRSTGMSKKTSKKVLSDLVSKLNQELLEVGLKNNTGMSGCFRFRLPLGQYPLIGVLRDTGLYLCKQSVDFVEVLDSETLPLDTSVKDMISKIKDRYDTLTRCYTPES